MRFAWRIKQYHDAFLTSPVAFDQLDDLSFDAVSLLPHVNDVQKSRTLSNWSFAAMNPVDK